jgi:hypothetical protein
VLSLKLEERSILPVHYTLRICYVTDHIENTASNSFSVVSRVSVAAGMCFRLSGVNGGRTDSKVISYAVFFCFFFLISQVD